MTKVRTYRIDVDEHANEGDAIVIGQNGGMTAQHLGTAASLDSGTNAGNVPVLDANGELPNSTISSNVMKKSVYDPGNINGDAFDYDNFINTPTIPDVYDPVITFTQGGVTKGSISLNQAGTATIALDAGGVTAGTAIDITNNVVSSKYDDTTIKVDANNKLYVKIDDELKANSTLPVQNKVVKGAIDGLSTDIENVDAKFADYTKTTNLASVALSNNYNDLNYKPYIPDVIDNLNSTEANKALSANQGKQLKGMIDDLKAIGKFLSLWDSSTGMPISFPQGVPYTYSTGDYFLVAAVDTTTNYKPNGASYTGAASSTVETGEVEIGDMYIYDGTYWLLQMNHGKSVSFANLTGQPTDNANLASALAAKADITSLGAAAFSNSYNDLINKPTIPVVNDATLTIQKNGATVNTFTANASSNVTANITVPTTVAELTDSSDFAKLNDLAAVALSNSYNDLDNKPSIPPFLSAGDAINITNNKINVIYDGVSIKKDANNQLYVDFTGYFNKTNNDSDDITEGSNHLFLTTSERTLLGNTSGVNTGDQSASDFDIKDLADSTSLRNTWNAKQDALIAGTNIQIANDGKTISATDTTYTATDFDIKDLADSTDLRTSWSNKAEVSDINTKTFTVSSTSDTTNAQAAVDYILSGKDAVILFSNAIYTLSSKSSSAMTFKSSLSTTAGDSYTTLSQATLTLALSSGTVTSITATNASLGKYLETDRNYTTPLTVSYNGSPATKKYVDDGLSTKQGTLTAGSNIQINNGTISATDTTYTAGTGISIDNGVISNTQTSAEWGNIQGDIADQTDLQTALSAKQDTLTAGSNINIASDGTISATDTTYTAGTNINIDANNEISATDTTYTAGTNVQISSGNVISATDTTYTASDFDIKDLADSTGKRTEWDGKQDALTAGANIQIDNDGTISATDTTYVASDFDIANLSDGFNYRNTWSGKQDYISDLETIRSGASAGATAVQPSALGTSAACDTGTSAGNVPILGYGGKLDVSVLPSVAVTDVFTVTNKTDLTTLTSANTGDIGIVTSESKTYILADTPYSTLSNWTELATPTDTVTSVNSKTGAVSLTTDDIIDTTATNKYVTASDKTTWNAKQDALVSGTNIKTINGTSLLGSGNITTPNTTYTAGAGISISNDNIISNTQTSAEWGNITGTLADQTDLNTALGNKANSSDVLTKTNTTSYTPSENYHPATKKYVDDAVNTASGGTISDEAYGSTWNGVSTIAPSKNAVYDKISAMDTTIAGKQNVLTQGSNIQITTSGNTTTISATDTTYSGGENIEIDANNKISANNLFIITESDVTVSTTDEYGVAPYNTSYYYTNININANAGIKWVEGAVYTFVVDTTMVVASAYRNVRVRIGSGTYIPVMGSSAILAGHSYFAKTQMRQFQYSTKYESGGALHLFSDSNTTYSSMSVSEGKTGTSTSARSIRADVLKEVIKYHAVDDTEYGSSRDGRTNIAPSKNAVYDKISAMDTTISGKQDALSTQTAYTSKGTSSKVPQITTNTLGQVTGITEVDINYPSQVSDTAYGSGWNGVTTTAPSKNAVYDKINSIDTTLSGLGTAATKNTGTSSGNVPVLDSNGKLDTSILPSIAITDTFTVSAVSGLTGLSDAKKGDIAIVTGTSETYILTDDPYSTAANWKKLATPTDAVTSVNTKTGAVTLDADDISDSTTTNKFVTASEKSTWSGKQNALDTQTAYTSKGTASKVPQITTNSLGQVTGITEVNISYPSQVSDTAYATSWNGVTGTAPSKNAVYDKISAMDTTIGNKANSSDVLAKTASAMQTCSVTGSGATTALALTSNTTSSYIALNGSNGFLGSYGVTSDKKPTFYNGSSYTLATTDQIPSYSNATQSAAGLMSATDKAKLDGIAAGAQVNTVTSVNGSTGAVTISSLPASDVYAWAKASTKPSYTFNEIGAGAATIGDGANYILFRSGDLWKAGIYDHTTGDEAVVFANVNTRTSRIFANTDPTARADWTTLSPSMHIKNGKVAIGKLIANGAYLTYPLEVNGGIQASSFVKEGGTSSQVLMADGSTKAVSEFGGATTRTITLEDTGWNSSNQQTISVSGVTASNTVIVSPAPANIGEYTGAGIYCSAQASGTLTFTCASLPDDDISVNVAILG